MPYVFSIKKVAYHNQSTYLDGGGSFLRHLFYSGQHHSQVIMQLWKLDTQSFWLNGKNITRIKDNLFTLQRFAEARAL